MSKIIREAKSLQEIKRAQGLLNRKDKGLTNISLFKNNFCKSWAYLPKTGQIVVHEDTPATNWDLYKAQQVVNQYSGTGYRVNFYKSGLGIKGATPGEPKKPTVQNNFAQGFIKYGIEQGYIK